MKKVSTHSQSHIIDDTGHASDEDAPHTEENLMKDRDNDPEKLLEQLDVKVPDRVMHRLFLRIRISTLRNRN